jgi:hypothetical protein
MAARGLGPLDKPPHLNYWSPRSAATCCVQIKARSPHRPRQCCVPASRRRGSGDSRLAFAIFGLAASQQRHVVICGIPGSLSTLCQPCIRESSQNTYAPQVTLRDPERRRLWQHRPPAIGGERRAGLGPRARRRPSLTLTGLRIPSPYPCCRSRLYCMDALSPTDETPGPDRNKDVRIRTRTAETFRSCYLSG